MLYAVGTDLATLQNAGAVPTWIAASKTFTGAANLGEVGVNEIFNKTGAYIWLEGLWIATIDNDWVDAVDGAHFRIGVTDNDSLFTGTEFEGAFDLDTIDELEGLFTTGTAASVAGAAENIAYKSDLAQISGGVLLQENQNIILTISDQNITGGGMLAVAKYFPVSRGAVLTLGAGMVAI